MSKITNTELETEHGLKKAVFIMNDFFNNRALYSDQDVYKKSGIEKILSEEYIPLVRLAKKYPLVKSISLYPKGHQGPDGKIKFWWGGVSNVQITCSSEGVDQAYLREQLAEGKIAFKHQKRTRDKKTKIIANSGRASITPQYDVDLRYKRVLLALNNKNSKFHSGTDTLVIQEDSANFKHLKKSSLHKEIRKAVKMGAGSSYKKIYIIYGQVIRRIK